MEELQQLKAASEKIVNQETSLDEFLDEMDEIIELVREKYDDLDSKHDGALEEILDLESDLEDYKNKFGDADQETIMIPENLIEVYKVQILNRFFKNLSLAQLERLETLMEPKLKIA